VGYLSRSQLLVYGAVAIAVLLVGIRWLRSSDPAPRAGGPVSGGGSLKVSGKAGGRDVIVHVTGAVRRPGVYRLPQGSRVGDAVERAGGASDGDSVEGVNLAARLSDGQQIVVPKKGAAVGGAGGAGAAGAADPEGPISLGSATLEQLDTIEGIGPKTAQDIIDYREEHGGFSSVDEIDQVSGIGPKTMEALRDRLQP
jgi:competence protein ComEA